MISLAAELVACSAHEQQVPYFAAPTIAAGDDLANDSLECELEPLARENYPAKIFTNLQWARMEEIFASGVCDWSRPPVSFQPSIAWLSYASGPGGQPLGPALGAEHRVNPPG